MVRRRRRRRVRPRLLVWAAVGAAAAVAFGRAATGAWRPPWAPPPLRVVADPVALSPLAGPGPALDAAVGRVHAFVLEDDGRIVAALRPKRPYPIASTAKIMTAFLALQSLPPTAPVTATAHDVAVTARQAAQGGVEMPVRVGERWTVRQLLQAMMLPSANNAAVLLAERAAGDEAAFVRRMNREAARLGMVDTHYADASGLSPRTQASALDLARLAGRALALPAFAALVSARTAPVPGWGRVVNLNRLLWTYPGAVGVKTGYTDQAGNCLVFAARRRVGGREVTVLGVLLGVDSPQSLFADAASMLDAGFAWAPARTLLPAGYAVGELERGGREAGRLVLARALRVPAYERLEPLDVRLGHGRPQGWRAVVVAPGGAVVAAAPVRVVAPGAPPSGAARPSPRGETTAAPPRRAGARPEAGPQR
jgi:D-alanyl-D-alanine carboxypeptidase (penicillin-binding protein 5/6)